MPVGDDDPSHLGVEHVDVRLFVVGLSVLLRRAEGEVPWRSAIVMGSGVLFVALGLSGLGNEAAVALRAGDLDP